MEGSGEMEGRVGWGGGWDEEGGRRRKRKKHLKGIKDREGSKKKKYKDKK